MRKLLGAISFLSLILLSSGSLYAMEASDSENHMPESVEEKAEDMNMEKSEHEAVKTKAHMKYQNAMKMAESEYKLTIMKAAKTKNPKKVMMQAKTILEKSKKSAEAMYQKEKGMGMKTAKKKVVSKEKGMGMKTEKKKIAPMMKK
ncbi:hypothetical protein HY621_02435 [Candidatus Uhrbacteria bacterium]|nr:hypothetical protein [Candidatus Uhrbacteria bacterium]